MPKSSRALSGTEIAQIWARRLINTKKPEAVMAFQSTKLENHILDQNKIEELVRILPDAPLPASVMKITDRLEVSPIHLPESWMKSALKSGKYSLASWVVGQMPTPEKRSILVCTLVDFLCSQTTWTPVQIRMASETVKQVIQDYALHIKSAHLPREQRPVSRSGDVGKFISLVMIGEAHNEVLSAIPPRSWHNFCSYVVKNKNSIETYHLGIRSGDIDWLEATSRRAKLDKIASANQPSEDKTGSRHKRPAM